MARLEQLRPILDSILRSEGVPLDLAFVAVVESGGKSDALSPKGARGLWQLMPETARRYGLVIAGDRDDRLDVEKSTRAAAQYLRDLHTQFGSWPTALAAYNAGEQAVQRAIDRAQSEEFRVLASRELLPLETRMYVPAVVNLMAGSGDLPSVAGPTTQPSRDAWIVYAVRTKEGSEPHRGFRRE
jgi:membrane-bound lytic murein transglycosylase D